MIFDQFGTFSISDSFPRENKLGTRVKFAAVTQVHFYLYRYRRQRNTNDIINHKDISRENISCKLNEQQYRMTLHSYIAWGNSELQLKRTYLNFHSFSLRESMIIGSFSSRESMIKKENSDHSETISNRFLMSKLVYRTIFDQFGTFSIFAFQKNFG